MAGSSLPPVRKSGSTTRLADYKKIQANIGTGGRVNTSTATPSAPSRNTVNPNAPPGVTPPGGGRPQYSNTVITPSQRYEDQLRARVAAEGALKAPTRITGTAVYTPDPPVQGEGAPEAPQQTLPERPAVGGGMVMGRGEAPSRGNRMGVNVTSWGSSPIWIDNNDAIKGQATAEQAQEVRTLNRNSIGYNEQRDLPEQYKQVDSSLAEYWSIQDRLKDPNLTEAERLGLQQDAGRIRQTIDERGHFDKTGGDIAAYIKNKEQPYLDKQKTEEDTAAATERDTAASEEATATAGATWDTYTSPNGYRYTVDNATGDVYIIQGNKVTKLQPGPAQSIFASVKNGVFKKDGTIDSRQFSDSTRTTILSGDTGGDSDIATGSAGLSAARPGTQLPVEGGSDIGKYGTTAEPVEPADRLVKSTVVDDSGGNGDYTVEISTGQFSKDSGIPTSVLEQHLANGGSIGYVDSKPVLIDRYGERYDADQPGYTRLVQSATGEVNKIRATGNKETLDQQEEREFNTAEAQIKTGVDFTGYDQATDKLLKATQQKAARNKALALHAMMEQGAESGSSVNQMMGASTEAGYAYDTDAQQQDAALRLERETQKLKLKTDQNNQLIDLYMKRWAGTKDEGVRTTLANQAAALQRENNLNQEYLTKLQIEAQNQGPSLGMSLLKIGVGALGAIAAPMTGGLSLAAAGGVTAALPDGSSGGAPIYVPQPSYNPAPQAPGSSYTPGQYLNRAPGQNEDYFANSRNSPLA